MATCLWTYRLTHTQLNHQRLVSDKSAIPVICSAVDGNRSRRRHCRSSNAFATTRRRCPKNGGSWWYARQQHTWWGSLGSTCSLDQHTWWGSRGSTCRWFRRRLCGRGPCIGSVWPSTALRSSCRRRYRWDWVTAPTSRNPVRCNHDSRDSHDSRPASLPMYYDVFMTASESSSCSLYAMRLSARRNEIIVRGARLVCRAPRARHDPGNLEASRCQRRGARIDKRAGDYLRAKDGATNNGG